MVAEERQKLEHIAGLTVQQAKEELIRGLENEARMEAAHMVKRVEDEARETASKQAQRIIGMAVQRGASDYVSETTVSVVNLPSDDMKGRIIGREGRNIPRPGDGHRRRPHRRRHARSGDPLRLRPLPPRDRPRLARAPDRRRPHHPAASRRWWRR
jgi:hypothetical protein